MTQLKKILYCILSFGVLVSLSACTTPEEQAKIDAENKEKAIAIAAEYFGDDFAYDFDFYGGGGEGDAAIDIYVFKDGDTIHCVSLPAKENAPGPRVYYDCELHQYSSGYWSLQHYEGSERVE
ncbi:MAG: hypothetical protein IJ468_01430 [Lachnospiraceae bacterium]|nr:hypothetical protein [Lachnospiraceae bacterium]